MKNILRFLVLFLFSLNILFALGLARNGNTVIDNSTNLQWQDDVHAKMARKDWDYAIYYCKQLILDGYTNWRLPMKNELLSLIDYSKSNPAIKEKVFKNIKPNYYWSSTPNATLSSYGWYISFDSGLVGYNKKRSREYVRCVRTIQ
jgi:hypothetical protein